MTCDSCHSHTLLTGLNEGRMLTAIKQRRCTAKSVDITSNGRISTRKVGVSWQLLNWQEKKWQLSKIHSVSILQKKFLSPLCWICWIYIFLNLGQHQAFKPLPPPTQFATWTWCNRMTSAPLACWAGGQNQHGKLHVRDLSKVVGRPIP